MDLPFSDVAIAGARGMLTLWTVGAVVHKVMPNAPNICDRIELGKSVLNFIGEAPEWVNYDKNLEKNIQSLKNAMEVLLSVERDVSQELEIEEFQKNKKRTGEVEGWLESAKRRRQEAIQLDTEIGQTRAFSRFLFRAWLGSCVEKKTKEINDLLEQKRAFEHRIAVDSASTGRVRLLTSELVGEVAAGVEEKIWESITNPEVTILGVEGEQGMGKSTIMMHIYNKILDAPSMFDSAFYINISEEKKAYELQTAIGRELKLQDLENENGLIRRAGRVQDALKLAKRFVLILDGLTSSFRLGQVGIPIENDGGKLVVVTQSRRVCQQMLCKSIISVNALPLEDARTLFMTTLNPSTDLSSEIVEIADEIIQKCDGLPIRIIKASEALRNEDDISYWRSRLDDLSNNC